MEIQTVRRKDRQPAHTTYPELSGGTQVSALDPDTSVQSFRRQLLDNRPAGAALVNHDDVIVLPDSHSTVTHHPPATMDTRMNLNAKYKHTAARTD